MEINQENARLDKKVLIQTLKKRIWSQEDREIIAQLSKTVDLNFEVEDGKYPIMYAMDKDDTQIFSTMVNNGANIYVKTFSGESLLDDAKAWNSKKIVKEIEDAIDFHKYQVVNAAFTGNAKAVEYFSNLGLNVNLKTNNGESIIFTAIEQGHTETLKELLEAGIDVFETNKDGKTAKEFADELNNKEAKQLIEQYMAGKSLIAVTKKQDIELVSKCIKYGVYIDYKDEEGKTALMYASAFENSEILKRLLNENSNVDQQDKNGTTALMIAAKNGEVPNIKLLIEKGADLNKVDYAGKTVFDYARENGKNHTLEVLERIENENNSSMEA